ncbi:hypothetical protein B7494_g2538 [Chlorociboria aeruginascens]|nr:hypothetical protein B7494_g2538 [Chlorociboria aeruginascens]
MVDTEEKAADSHGKGRSNTLDQNNQPFKLPPTPKFAPSYTKSKSMSEVQDLVKEGTPPDDDINSAIDRLKSQEPPISLEKARERRSSVKKERRDIINVIRERTASRASNSARPNLEDLQVKKEK